ncbi:sulfite exporter TauE/SafE family protein [Lacticaseibacillus thailandensis]|nr:sulfite exporter TauE/SafE family protein [Lacticaseibacillus thailandensis]
MHLFLINLYLLAAGIAAGLSSSMAGLASIVSYPALLSLGVPPVSANVTNTAALVFTGIGSTASSTKELGQHKKVTIKATVLALIGGIIGSLILVVAPASSFKRIVPFLILFAALLMVFSGRGQMGKRSQLDQQSLLSRGGANVAMLLVGLYTGYFGASAGVIMLAIMATNDLDFPVNNAIKNFASLIANFVAFIVYIFTANIYWSMVLPLGIGLFIGGYVGPMLVRHIPALIMRRVIIGLAFVLAGYLFVQEYF